MMNGNVYFFLMFNITYYKCPVHIFFWPCIVLGFRNNIACSLTWHQTAITKTLDYWKTPKSVGKDSTGIDMFLGMMFWFSYEKISFVWLLFNVKWTICQPYVM